MNDDVDSNKEETSLTLAISVPPLQLASCFFAFVLVSPINEDQGMTMVQQFENLQEGGVARNEFLTKCVSIQQLMGEKKRHKRMAGEDLTS